MALVLLIIHLFVTLALIGVVLIQRSEGGGLGIGSSQGMGAFMGGRGTANLLTRTTAVLATIFFVLSLALALIGHRSSGGGLLSPPPPAATSPAPLPTGSAGAPPALPPVTAPPPAKTPAPTGPLVPTK